ncbi:MAG: family transposase [Symbiobacteriaceae bacterium]|jgi:transposase-like protein|nr:family transposase [Symbiobacteriaceae bacterium]
MISAKKADLSTSAAPPCPHCAGHETGLYGSFPLKDGTRQQRFRCRRCRRTFSQYTGTPLYYLKKRELWGRNALAMSKKFSVRRTAAVLKVRVSTAFRWRHRLLGAVSGRPQAPLSGQVAVGEVYIRYSAKGSRQGNRPGAIKGLSDAEGLGQLAILATGPRPWGGSAAVAGHTGPSHAAQGPRPFRRFVDGKPSCVLLAANEKNQLATPLVGTGRPSAADLSACLKAAVRRDAVLFAAGLAPFAEACRRLAIACHEAPLRGRVQNPGRSAELLRSALYGWLRSFRGVATRYLGNYLAWFRHSRRFTHLAREEASHLLLREAAV